MTALSYKLIALDLDGTLFGEDLVIRPRVRHALWRAIDRGIHVTLATGRAFPHTARIAGDLGIETPLICYQGGLIKHPLTGQVLHAVTMSRSLAEEAIHLAEREGLHLSVYVDDEVYLTKLRYPREFYDRWFTLPLRIVDNLVAALAGEPIKFLVIAEPPDADRIEPAWKAHFEGRVVIVRSHRYFVEGNPPGVSKGAALARLADYLGVRREETIAIGDNDNDRSMIEWAGLGIAMGNAPADLRAVADYVAPPVDADGVADVVERLITGRLS